MIELRAVSFFYAPGQTALRDVSLRFRAGERVVVFGANGAGKSTLLQLINGLLAPCAGTVTAPAHLGTLLQEPDDQLFGATVLDDVALGPLERGRSDADARRAASLVLETLGIAAISSRPIHALSLGEKKRVALAGLLVEEPEALLLDEPAAGLDAPGSDALIELLVPVPLVVVATHDTDLLNRWATRAVILRQGRVVFDGRAEELEQEWDRHATGCGLRRPRPAEVWR